MCSCLQKAQPKTSSLQIMIHTSSVIYVTSFAYTEQTQSRHRADTEQAQSRHRAGTEQAQSRHRAGTEQAQSRYRAGTAGGFVPATFHYYIVTCNDFVELMKRSVIYASVTSQFAVK